MAPAAERGIPVSDDTALHAMIREAQAAGRIAVAVNYAKANRNSAPGYRTTDLVVPWFAGAAVSIYVGVTYGAATGTALFVMLAGVIVVALRPYNRRRAETRYRTLSLATLEHWEALWRLGALTLHRPGHTVESPDGDWREMARALPDDSRSGAGA
jgi:hypothetical protein